MSKKRDGELIIKWDSGHLTQALKLRRKGLNNQAIAEAMGFSRSTIQRKISQALKADKALQGELIEELRQLEAERLDALQVAIWDAAVEAGDIASAETILKIIDRRVKLFGLNAPAKQEVSGFDGEPIQITVTYVNQESPS